MKIYDEWMSDNDYFGEDYPNNKLLDDAKYRFELQKQSNEGKNAKVDGVSERIVAQNHTNPLNQTKYDKKLSFDTISSVHTGSLIEFDDKKWLITSTIFDKQAYKVGSVQECNNTLKYYKNSVLFEVPIVIESGVRLYSLGQDSTKYINTLSDEIIVYASSTANIGVDDVYKIGRRNYKVMTVQDVLIDGLLVIKMEVTVEEVEGVVHNYIIEILNGAEQTVKYGESLVLNAQVKDKGVLISPTPPLLFESSNGTVCTVNDDGVVLATSDSGSAIITVKLASVETITASIKIIAAPASVVNNTYTLVGNIQPDTQILLNQTKIFTATKYDSEGNSISCQFAFQIVGTAPIDKYSLTVIDDNRCSIQALDYPYTIILRAVDNSNSQYIEKQITLMSLV